MQKLIASMTMLLLLVVLAPTAQAAPKQCNDGSDNDGDGLTDFSITSRSASCKRPAHGELAESRQHPIPH